MAAIDPIRNAMNVTFSTPEAPKVSAPQSAPQQMQEQPQAEVAAGQTEAPSQDYSRQENENQAATLSISMPSKEREGEETEEQIQKQNEKLRKSIEEINKKAANSEVQFGYHEATNRVTIKVVDKETKKVIKEFPPEKTLDMIAKVWEMAGLMVDEKR